MEANKDGAMQCRNLANNALQRGDKNTAVRLLEKSIRMFPDESTKRLLDSLKGISSDVPNSTHDYTQSQTNSPSSEGTSGDKQDSGEVRRRHVPNSSDNVRTDSTLNEQEKLCRRILTTKDHYAVLGVDKTSSDDEIKRSYKKLAFQLHPDKNKAPSAEEGFKKISKAFQCLSDPKKRALYDQFGNDDDVPQQYRSQYESDILSPEELFEAFFGVDLSYGGQRRIYRRIRRPQAHTASGNLRFGNLLQMLPVFILLGITILSSIFQPQPKSNFEFQKSAAYPVEQKTPYHKVKYFTSQNFAEQYPPMSRQRYEVELDVEVAHFSKLCKREHTERLIEIQRISTEIKSDRERRHHTERVNRQEMRNCKVFAELRSKSGRYY